MYPLSSTFCHLHDKNIILNKEEEEKRSTARNLKTLFVVCSSSNVHKISANQTGFTQFQGVFIRAEKVITYHNLNTDLKNEYQGRCLTKLRH